MKKARIGKTALVAALIMCFTALFTTCKNNIGLGGTLNIYPPNGGINYPDAGETPIRGSFVLKGTASDGDGIKSISVVFENIDTKEKTKAYNAERFSEGDVSVSWTINVDNESTGTEEGHELVKLYPIPDGEYTAIVSVTDMGGKASKFTKNYKIDNTPPVFIVSRPSTAVAASAPDTPPPQADGYGATFSIVGQAGERNTVEKLDVLVDGVTLAPVLFVGNNINAQIAVFSKTEPKDPLYELQEQIKKPLRSRLYLYDNAREYKGGAASGEGNKTDWYYQWDAIHTDIIAKGYTSEVISDYFAGKKGSNASDANEHDRKIYELRKDAVALGKLKSAMIKMDADDPAAKQCCTFKLDPSISPGFKVIGTKSLPTSSLNLVQATSMLFKAGSETAFSVELIRNKDNTPLVGGTTLGAYTASNIEIVLQKWNKAPGTNEVESFKKEENLTEVSLLKFSDLTEETIRDRITVENGNLRVKCVFPATEAEGYYAVKVKGTDTIKEDAHKFVAYDDSNTANYGMYILNFLDIGTGPRIRPIRPQGYQKGNFEIFADITGIDGSGVVYYNIDAPVNDASPDATKTLTKADPSNPSDPKYKTTINISTLGDGDHEIHFFVKSGSGSSDTDKTTFAVDTKAPSADIGFPLPTDPQAGKITISGTINDGSGSGVKEAGTKYILGKKSSTPLITDSGWQNMTTSTKGSWNVDVDLDTMSTHPGNYGTQVGTSSYYKVPLYIRTEDMLGNATVHTKEILFNSDGTKPVVRVLSPQADAVVGGTIQIFGTASAVTGGPSAVGEVYVQFSKTTDFTNQANMTFGTSGSGYDANWYQGGNGQRVPGTGSGPGEKGSEWRLEINGNGAFNGASQRQDVYFRFRAKNKNNNRLGEWTTPIKIIVDKDAPVITDVKIDNASGASAPQNYETNMWIGSGKKLTAKLTDPSGIKEVKITSAKMSGGISYTQTTAPAGWLTPYSGGGVSGYTLSIPLNISGMSDNDFSIKVEITENTTTGLKSDSTFTFRFDTIAPKGFFGSGLYINSGYFGDSSVTNAALADKLRDLGANTSSGAGCKILADNTELTVTSVSGSTVSFTPSTTAKEYNYILYKPETLIYNEGSSSPWIVNGVANDDGSGVAKVEAWVMVDNGSTTHTIITETDNTNKITRQLGGQVTWKGQINLSSLKDGKGTLHYKITDKSGNEYAAPPVNVRVKNKPVKVSKITLATKIGGSAVEFANDNVNKALKDIDVDANLDFTANYTSSAFAFKDKDNSKIKVNFTGGEGQVKYNLKYAGNVLAGHNMQNISTDDAITLSEDNLNTIGNTTDETTKELVLELWDSAHDCTPTGTAPLEKRSFAEVKINTLFEAIDTKPPTVVILPFHWNKEDDNSLYQNSRANGHVEIDTSSVSGKVTIRGFAYDNIKLDKIEATFQDGAPLNVTATRTGNTWASNKTMAANDVELKVTHLGADYLGYYVKWELSFDSSKIPMGVAKDIKVIANDGGRNSVESGGTGIPGTSNTVTRGADNSASHASFASAKVGQFVVFRTGEKQYFTRISGKNGNTIILANSVPVDMDKAAVYDYSANKTKTAVKSVPYITGVSRKSSYNTKRARSGAIPLLRGEAGNTITGFNFEGSAPSLKITENKDGSGSSPVEMASLTLSSDKKSFSFTVPDTAKDGYLHLVVNGVAAVNNTNAYTESNMEKSNTYGTEKHSDDRFVHIWRVNKEDTFKGSKNAIYPAMTKGTDGTLYASFSNYSKSEVYYSSAFTGSSTVAVGGTGTTKVFTGYDPPEETDITVSGMEVNVLYAANYQGGQSYSWGDGHTLAWNDTSPTSAGGIYLYDKDAPSTLVGNGRSAKIYRFELFTYDNELQQFKNIRTLRSGDNIYTVYYDRLTGAVKFAWVDDSKKPDTSGQALPWCVIDGNTDVTDTDSKVPDAPASAPDAQKKFTFVNPDGSTAEAKPYILNGFEDGLSVSNAVWESIAVTTTTQGYPVVVYMDAATGSLRLARSTKKQPAAPADWKIQKVLASSDPNGNLASDYINACIGTDGILHIAFQNTKGQLVYVKSTNTSDTGSARYTFGSSEVLDDSGTSIDMTMDDATPYISYVSRPNSYDAIRIAYRTSMDFNNTGTNVAGWETMTAPLNERAANSRICIETQAKHYNATEKLPVAVGFTTGSDYRAAFYVGK